MAKKLPKLQINDKWSIEYDPSNNDRPVAWYRYNEFNGMFDANNAYVAMFYAMLAHEQHNLEGG